ncbi:glycosyltransferase [Limibaculum sp. M0105]|uniref:Glycosyltransferase n=1 Tax=Thermohalobaculum xanthum TaxID=2753746 RepID=A0A8J7M9R9_9RHOB|nr:glycosyltransferase [Thermohalobaculum xanthum]MBK0400380.1 glycosyltransferase [Thermohalobaculum xanthum]
MNQAVLALAATSFNKPSETFIRDHARMIAPGQTILLSQFAPDVGLFEYPVLSGLDLGGHDDSPVGRLVKVRRDWRRYLAPELPTADRTRAVAFLRAHGATALMAEYGMNGALLSASARAADVPLFVHFHGFDASVVPRLPLWKRRYRRLFDDAAGVFAPSEFIAEILIGLGCPEAKVNVVPCGIDADRFTPSRPIPGRVVAVGRLVAKKAPHLTIEAFGRVAGRFPHARLDVIGAGPLAQRCRSVIAKYDLGERVRLHGRQSHEFVASLMREASVFAQHSVTSMFGDVEGLPVSVLEAMASSLPVVATRHSGIAEAVLDGETGILVEERDVGAMAMALAAMLEQPERAQAMGRAGRVRALEHYSQAGSVASLRRIMAL